MKTIIKVNHKPKPNGSKWDCYQVTFKDGDNTFNAHLTRNEFRTQELKEKFEALTYDSSFVKEIWDIIKELEELAYARGQQDEIESNAGASL